jgi:hypothetical protein
MSSARRSGTTAYPHFVESSPVSLSGTLTDPQNPSTLPPMNKASLCRSGIRLRPSEGLTFAAKLDV